MSIIKSIKQQLGLGPASENHFFDGSVPNQLTLKRGTPEAPGAELIKALDGVLSFPNQGQSLTGNGYVKLPGGLIIQWGVTTVVVPNTWGDQVFSVAFLNEVFSITIADAGTASTLNATWKVKKNTLSAFQMAADYPSGSRDAFWIAIGY